QPGHSRFGVFFGWRGPTRPFFFVEIDERPLAGFERGRATVGQMRVIKGTGAEADVFETKGLMGVNTTMALNKPIDWPKRGAWHTLVVRAADQTVTVKVDNDKSCSFTMAQLTEHNKGLPPPS